MLPAKTQPKLSQKEPWKNHHQFQSSQYSLAQNPLEHLKSTKMGKPSEVYPKVQLAILIAFFVLGPIIAVICYYRNKASAPKEEEIELGTAPVDAEAQSEQQRAPKKPNLAFFPERSWQDIQAGSMKESLTIDNLLDNLRKSCADLERTDARTSMALNGWRGQRERTAGHL